MHETEALHLRRLTAEDLEPLHRLLSDPAVMRYLEPPFTRAQTEAFLQKAGMGREPLIWAVEDGRGFAGYVIYHPYDETSMELGWVLASDRWGRGYALALTRQMICRARESGRDAVIECHPQQAATRHIAEKLGFRPCGMDGGCCVYRLAGKNE